MLRPYSVQGTQAPDGLHVAHNADDGHGRSLDDSHWFTRLLFVQLGARLLDLAHDVGHAGLVPHEGSEVGLLRGIITRERLALATTTAASLLGQKAQRSVTWGLKLTVRHPAQARQSPAPFSFAALRRSEARSPAVDTFM